MLIDLNQIIEDSQNFEPLEPGEYVGFVLSHELEMSKSKKAMVKWNFELVESKRRFFNYTLLDNPVGLGMFATTVANTGYTGDMKKFDIEKYCSSKEGLNKQLIIVLGQEEYNGHMQNFVKYTKAIPTKE